MFALEISFMDNVSQPEMLFLRRPQGLIGSSDYAHVVIEDMKQMDFQLRILRDVGRRFRCKAVPSREGVVPPMLDGSFDGEASLELGTTSLHITALDSDLAVREAEPPDRAGVRVLRQACATEGPLFPAVVVCSNPPFIVSFTPEQPLYIGRSKQCGLRLDSAEISARHARLGYESGRFWLEDLGSTNGTFVDGQQVSGRADVEPGVPIMLGREIVILGVNAAEQLAKVLSASPRSPVHESAPKIQTYPVLVSLSEVARPARLVLQRGTEVVIGREPGCDMWLGAPHVSRKHCVARMGKLGDVELEDTSTNGTAIEGGVLRRGDVLALDGKPRVMDFGGGVTVAICFDANQEKQFAEARGSLWSFSEKNQAGADGNAADAQGLSKLAVLAEVGGLLRALIIEPGSVMDALGGLSLRAKLLTVIIAILTLALFGVFINLLIGFSR